MKIARTRRVCFAWAALLSLASCSGGDADYDAADDAEFGQVQQALSTRILTFNLPLPSQPNSANPSSVLHTLDGWTLTVRKTGSDRSINVALKTVSVTLTSSHYTSFCTAFQGGSGTKTTTVVYNVSTVTSFGWQGGPTITLPDL